MRALPPRSTRRRVAHAVQLVCPDCGGASPVLERGRVLPASGRVLFEGRCEDCAAPLEASFDRTEFGTGLRDRLVAAGWHAPRAPFDVLHVVAARVAGKAPRAP